MGHKSKLAGGRSRHIWYSGLCRSPPSANMARPGARRNYGRKVIDLAAYMITYVGRPRPGSGEPAEPRRRGESQVERGPSLSKRPRQRDKSRNRQKKARADLAELGAGGQGADAAAGKVARSRPTAR